jgi:hypothetical protein
MQTQSNVNAAKANSTLSPAVQECIQSCIDCSQICSQLISHCLTLGGKHAEQKHIQLLIDCEQICSQSAQFMARNSAFYSSVCEARAMKNKLLVFSQF